MRKNVMISVLALVFCLTLNGTFALAASFETPKVPLFPSGTTPVSETGNKQTTSGTTTGNTGNDSSGSYSATSSGGGMDELPVDSSDAAPTASSAFTDVAADAYYAAPVAWAVEKGITNGVDASHFAPTSPCNRGQMVTFLWRAAGCPEPKGGTTKFTDVKADDYYAKAVAWAVENSVTLGMTETAFEPSSPVTRAQAVTFLWRAQSKPPATAGETFADVEGGSYYAEAVRWATANNVTNGTGNGFEPYTTVNRAMSVTFLYRVFR